MNKALRSLAASLLVAASLPMISGNALAETDSGLTPITGTSTPVETQFTYTTDLDGNATVAGCVDACPSDLVIPESLDGHPVTAIGEAAFAWTPLTSVSLPDSITTIAAFAFQGDGLPAVTLPTNLVTIGFYAFRSNALTSLTIPDSAVNVDQAAFEYNALTSVVLPSTWSYVPAWEFNYNALESVTIPESVTNVGDHAFSNNMITALTLPSHVTVVGNQAFANNDLSSLSLPDSLSFIDDWAFAFNHIPSLFVPDSVTFIGMGAFYSNALTSVTFDGAAPTVGQLVFDSNDSLHQIQVYYGTSGWGPYWSDGYGSYVSNLPVHVSAAPFTAPKFRFTQARNGKIRLSLTAAKPLLGADPTGYQYSTDGGVTWTNFADSSDLRHLTIEGLSNGVRYQLSARAVNGKHGGVPSTLRAVTPFTRPDVAYITEASSTHSAVRLAIIPPEFNGGRMITRYGYSLDGETWFNLGQSSSPLLIRGLKAGTTYQIRIRALNAGGWGAPSDAVEVTTKR